MKVYKKVYKPHSQLTTHNSPLTIHHSQKMNVPTDDNRFLDLLQKWQAGDFTRGDEQELQALARGDDFRREALEGFMLHPEEDHHTRLLALRARLQAAGAIRRTIFPQIWAAAAALVLLLAAFWFFRNPAPGPLDTIAQNEMPAVENQTLSDAAAPVETAPLRSKSVAPPTPAPGGPLASSGAVARSEPDRIESFESKDMVAAPAPVTPPAATVAGEQEASKPEADLAMEEVAVQKEQTYADDAKGAKKKAESAGKDARSRPVQQAPGNTMQTADFAMIALQDYLRRNARLPEAARQNNISGYVRLSFRLDPQRRATDFKVLRPLGYGCEEAAQSLLQAYNWRDFTQDSLAVEVPFVR